MESRLPRQTQMFAQELSRQVRDLLVEADSGDDLAREVLLETFPSYSTWLRRHWNGERLSLNNAEWGGTR